MMRAAPSTSVVSLAKARMLSLRRDFVRFVCNRFTALVGSRFRNSSKISASSSRRYQRSRFPMAAYSRIDVRYSRAVASTTRRRTLSSNSRARAAISKLATSRLTSHSHGPGSVSSKSLMSNTSERSGAANPPKFDRCASPQHCTRRPDTGLSARSAAITAAAPR